MREQIDGCCVMSVIHFVQVMTAASYWSLLAPAIEMAESSGNYGANGEWAFVPVAIGFALGAAFVYGADILLPHLVSPLTAPVTLSDAGCCFFAIV